MDSNLSNYFDLNKFFLQLKKNKKCVNKLKIQTIFLNKTKEQNYKILSLNLKKNTATPLVMYVLNINFFRSNTLLNVMDCSGNLKFFYSAGVLDFKGRQKTSRSLVLKSFYKLIVSKLKFLKGKPVVIHFKNVGLSNFWFLKKLKKKLFVVAIKNFNVYPYNGCRLKKIRRKK